jgi:hypothetical protein
MQRKSATALITTLALTLSAAFLVPESPAQRVARSPNKKACWYTDFYDEISIVKKVGSFTFADFWTLVCTGEGDSACTSCIEFDISYFDPDIPPAGEWVYDGHEDDPVSVACGQSGSGWAPNANGTFFATGPGWQWSVELHVYHGGCPHAAGEPVVFYDSVTFTSI